MSSGKIISPAEVDFWLDVDKYSSFIETGLDPIKNDTMVFSIDMVRLASIRTAISNFVRILTRKSVPVYFNNEDNNSNYGGDIIYISAKINTKQDFDCAVGQALHEGAHTLKTEFDVIKCAIVNVPHNIFKLSDSKNIRRSSIEKFILTIFNIIEDRYIDNYVFNEAPGYRGYYVSLYERFWNCPEIDQYLTSDLFRYPSLDSYSFRIMNFTNENTDLLALPCLEDIARLIDISNIDRLENTKDRIDVAFKVVELVLECIDKQEQLEGGNQGLVTPKGLNGLAKPEDYFEYEDEDEDDEKSEASVDVGNKIVNEISDVLSGRNKSPEKMNENDKAVGKISDDPEIDKAVKKKLDKLVDSQRKFLRGDLPKEALSESQRELLDLIDKHGIFMVTVELPSYIPGDSSMLKVDCLVVKKMTKDLILAGNSIFPLSTITKLGETVPDPNQKNLNAVNKGISLGTKLGRKLQIRNVTNPIKSIRKKNGKINKRQLHEAAFDSEDLFYNINIEEYRKASLHITVDASASMQGEKWYKTMTSVVAICKATSMIDNIHVTVSFRTTQLTVPYIVIAYDSKIDKFSKIKTLFPYLSPDGGTPEGLAFSAIMDTFTNITPDEVDRYFLNLSDGEPFFLLESKLSNVSIKYHGEVGVSHTKSQVDKIRKYGVDVLSYFIYDGGQIRDGKNALESNFKRMYGKNAKFITVDEVNDLAKTLNDLFLSKKSS